MFSAEFPYFIILGQGPNNINSHGRVDGSYIWTGWVHHHPGGTWRQRHMFHTKNKNNVTQTTSSSHLLFRVPLGQSRLMPSLTMSCPSHNTAQTRSPGPQLIWTTSPGRGTSSHEEPSGLWWQIPSLNHTWTERKELLDNQGWYQDNKRGCVSFLWASKNDYQIHYIKQNNYIRQKYKRFYQLQYITDEYTVCSYFASIIYAFHRSKKKKTDWWLLL